MASGGAAPTRSKRLKIRGAAGAEGAANGAAATNVSAACDGQAESEERLQAKEHVLKAKTDSDHTEEARLIIREAQSKVEDVAPLKAEDGQHQEARATALLAQQQKEEEIRPLTQEATNAKNQPDAQLRRKRLKLVGTRAIEENQTSSQLSVPAPTVESDVEATAKLGVQTTPVVRWAGVLRQRRGDLLAASSASAGVPNQHVRRDAASGARIVKDHEEDEDGDIEMMDIDLEATPVAQAHSAPETARAFTRGTSVGNRSDECPQHLQAIPPPPGLVLPKSHDGATLGRNTGSTETGTSGCGVHDLYSGRSTVLPATFDGDGDDSKSRDLSKLKLHADHARRPLWVCSDGRIVFESFHPQAFQVTDFLIAISEPVSRPEILHEYQITMLSLNAAISTGVDVEDLISVLSRQAKNTLDEELVRFIRDHGQSFGKLKIVLRNNRHFLEAADGRLLRKLCNHREISASLVQPLGEESQASLVSVEVNSLRVEKVKEAAHGLHLPLQQEYEYTQDRTEDNPELSIVLRPTASLRPYQQRALSKMFSIDGVAKSGIIVLPCGAGKSLSGIAACCRIRRRTLVLTTTAVSVDQWRRQLLQWTTIPQDDVYTFTAERKIPIEDAERRACVFISTYSMLGFSGKRSDNTELVLSQIQQLDWGLLIVDEVQVMPARTFRTVATTVKAHCILGLTATLVREDNLIHDLHWLIGPKLYEASWQQLQEDGHLARVRCVEVWCDMAKPFFEEYLQAIDDRIYALQRALWTCNPNKLKVCEYLIRFHEQRGDKTIVFSDNVFILEQFAKRLGRYYICGKVDMRERMQILSSFTESPSCNTVFLSKVGDNAIDIPNASVIIQISSHYGSRRQEAQRLGRILRPKPKMINGSSNSKYNAFFYSIVSRDTQEMYYANRRQQFLVEQGYNYHVLRDESVQRLESAELVYASEDAQLELLKQVLESVKRGEDAEAEEEDVALHSVAATPAAPAAVREPEASTLGVSGRPTSSTRPPEEQTISLASLSGGLDGRYTVTTLPGQPLKHLKPGSSSGI